MSTKFSNSVATPLRTIRTRHNDDAYDDYVDKGLMAMSPAEWEAVVQADRERIEKRHREHAAILLRRKA